MTIRTKAWKAPSTELGKQLACNKILLFPGSKLSHMLFALPRMLLCLCLHLANTFISQDPGLNTTSSYVKPSLTPLCNSFSELVQYFVLFSIIALITPNSNDLSIMDQIQIFPPNSYVEILTPNVIVLGSGAFGRCLGHEDGTLVNGISAFIRETPQSSLSHRGQSVRHNEKSAICNLRAFTRMQPEL